MSDVGTAPKRAFIPFALPDIGEEEIAEVVDALRSGWITTGPKARLFEQQFAAYIGSDVEAIAVNSATAGLHLAVEALGISPGDEVITTTYTFTATAEVIRYMGAHPVLVDVDPKSFCIDTSKISAAITSRTKAILPVHYAGMAADMDSVFELARRHQLRVVEDAAHAIPTTYGSKLIGTLESDATVFSFYATKTIATGEGGMLVTRNPDIANRCRVMRLHGINRDVFDRYTSKTPAWYYEIVGPGFKYNMTDIAASIGIQQLKKISRFHERRKQIASRYDHELCGLPIISPPRPDTDAHSWHLYVIQLERIDRISRDEFIARMAEEGVGCSVHYIPLHLHPYWRDTYGFRPEQFPNAQALYQRAVSLPIYTRMTDDDQSRVIDAIRKILS
jgi:dTDP-4-amino-4,6-dideoxygalactose transaminase